MLEPANWGLGTLHIHLCRHAHRGDPCHPLQGMMATPCCTVLTPLQVARTRKGGLRCTSWTCLKGVIDNANILWFAQAVDDTGEFGSFKLMVNLARFQRFAGIFGSYQQAMCLFQLVHWNFVEHGPRAAHSLRAALIFLDNPTSPDCRLQLHRLVELYTIDKEACSCLPHCDAALTDLPLFAGN